MVSWVALACLAVACASAQEPVATPAASGLKPEWLSLARIKVRMSENLSRLPNYTCLETVERSTRRQNRGKFELIDTLRLEVAMVDHKEMYAWPGAKKFDEKPLSEMLGSGGAIGTGTFGTLAHAVFLSNTPRFEYAGETLQGSRRLLRYDFHVPLMLSGYNISVVGRGSATTAYRGSFWADAESLDVARLEIEAVDIPPQLRLLTTRDVMSYERVDIGSGSFLLPRSAELSMADMDGSENRNRIELTQCRQYTGNSVISFDEVELKPAEKDKTPQSLPEIPAGLDVWIRLESPIEEGQAAVGDPVLAVIDGNVKVKRQVVIPKGAKLAGRISRLSRMPASGNRGPVSSYVDLGLDFTTLVIDGAEGPVQMTVEEVARGTTSPAHFDISAPQERNVVRVLQNKLRLPRGTLIRLRSVAASKETP